MKTEKERISQLEKRVDNLQTGAGWLLILAMVFGVLILISNK